MKTVYPSRKNITNKFINEIMSSTRVMSGISHSLLIFIIDLINDNFNYFIVSVISSLITDKMFSSCNYIENYKNKYFSTIIIRYI